MSLIARPRTSRLRATGAAFLVTLFAALCALGGGAVSASASSNQLGMFEEPTYLQSNPARTLQTMRSLGVSIVRVEIPWAEVAASPNSRSMPGGNLYPDANWAPFDTIVSQAHQDGIQVDLMLTGGAPLWATQTGAPSGFAYVWKPNASLFGQFVQAAASRYSSVHFFEVWNEGNWGPSLAPQKAPGSRVYNSAALYRSLLDAGYSALRATGHGSDTIVDDSLSPDGSSSVNSTNIASPLTWIRQVYCLDNNYRPLRGVAASQAGCPTSKSATRGFSSAHPALFRTSGFGVHPYGYGNPPSRAAFPNADSVELAELPQMAKTLDGAQRAYGSRRRMAIYNTEYGYETRPPQSSRQFPTTTTAASYLNQAEYISYKNPRVLSYDQYEVIDEGWFTTGLYFNSGSPKPSYFAYRMPIWLPVSSTRKGRSLEVWGGVRPANFARSDTGQAQTAYIQFQRGSGAWTTVKAVRITNSRGYFDLRVKFPGSGQVRIAWSYPAGDANLQDPMLGSTQSWIYSRTTGITVR